MAAARRGDETAAREARQGASRKIQELRVAIPGDERDGQGQIVQTAAVVGHLGKPETFEREGDLPGIVRPPDPALPFDHIGGERRLRREQRLPFRSEEHTS